MSSWTASKSASRSRAPIFLRLRAWWAGAENVELFARYGEKPRMFQMMGGWSSTLMLCSCIFVGMHNHNVHVHGEEALGIAELNRQRFYRRDFAPDYDPHSSSDVYSGATGYQTLDPVTGIHRNADNQFVAPPRHEYGKMRREMPEPPVTEEMLARAKAVAKRHA